MLKTIIKSIKQQRRTIIDRLCSLTGDFFKIYKSSSGKLEFRDFVLKKFDPGH